MKRFSPFLFILLSVFFQTLSAICIKFAGIRMQTFTPQAIITNPYYLGTLVCLGLQAICWPLALRRFPLFWAYLLMSGVYILIPFVSHLVFHETISAWNAAGLVIITCGIIFVLTGGRRERHV